jgi:hypothetical protein
VPWARDLARPLPLAAVAVLALNDHVLKGSGVLPSWLTGKLSDVAGLFFFPILLVVLARGLLAASGRRASCSPALPASAALATGVGFTLVKLWPEANAVVGALWGPMVLDATDLLALPALPLAVAFLVRQEDELPAHAASASRRWLQLASVFAAALASMATSRPQPVPAVPIPAVAADPDAGAVAVVTQRGAPCGEVAMTVCERSPSGSFLVFEARGADPGCTVEVLEASEISPAGSTPADKLPAAIELKSEVSTFAVSFLRDVPAEARSAQVAVALTVRVTPMGGGEPREAPIETTGACRSR